MIFVQLMIYNYLNHVTRSVETTLIVNKCGDLLLEFVIGNFIHLKYPKCYSLLYLNITIRDCRNILCETVY